MNNRSFIYKNEGELTVLQLIGFSVMIVGIIILITFSFIPPIEITPGVISISFFISMLGFALAFPSLLEGIEGYSTMRIIVFMVTNVICMLLLKIGWTSNILSLESIGLDQYWVGVIAFVFGAKATQSFFESNMAEPKQNTKIGMNQVAFSNAEIAKLAVIQNEQYLKVKYRDIVTVSDAVDDINSDTYVVTLYLKNNNTAGIPDKLGIRMPDGSYRTIATEIVKGVDEGRIHLSQKDKIINGNSEGSICCIVETSQGNMAVTSGHVYSKGYMKDYGGILENSEQSVASFNGNISGNWKFQLIDTWNDIALATFNSTFNDPLYISFKGKKHYVVEDKDIKNTLVKVVSAVGNSNGRQAYILDYNTAWDVRYKGKKITKSNIIVIGSTPDRNTSQSVSYPGDSGGCVYEPESGDLLGLVLGGNSKFTWVLPVKDIFEEYNFKLS